jgi:hypothetical protein
MTLTMKFVVNKMDGLAFFDFAARCQGTYGPWPTASLNRVIAEA